MKLPRLPYSSGISKKPQTAFGGLDHNLGAGDGSLWDMRNLTSDYYPLLASRRERRILRTVTEPGGIFSWDGLAWAADGEFRYDGEKKGTLSAGRKTFTALGAYIIILPDKAYYNTETGEFGSLEAEWSGGSLTFTNGTLFEEAAEANAIEAEGADWAALGFKAGDAVTIEGCTKHPENNKTPVIREVAGNRLCFYEYIFTLDGEDGTEPYTETGALTVKRSLPDMDYICENENRLWGCKGNNIYASKLGDPFNWNVFEGLATDAYAVDTGSAGSFTGCCSFLGYPCFFKEEHIYKVYGSMPSNFEVMGSATLGVAEGSGSSLAIAGETLFYLSRAGIMAYSGGVPQPIGEAFGLDRFRDAVGGSDGLKYYVSMRREDGVRLLCVYDTQRGLWHIEDETEAVGFARHGGNLCMLAADGRMLLVGGAANAPEDAGHEGAVRWSAEFGDFTEGDPNKKGVSKIQIRLELDAGAELEVEMMFDSSGEWLSVAKLYAAVKRSYYLPIIPRRGDHYRLRLTGAGGCRVYSITRESYSGSELKSRPGRQ